VDLLQRLNSLNQHKVSFKKFNQVAGTGWSIAGIVSTQCAVPLKLVTMLGNNTFGDKVSHFLPNAICLGDILSQHGYKNIYMNGSDIHFAGVGNFLEDHHYDELYGRDEWLKLGVAKESDLLGWGLSDDVLFEQAKLKLDALMKSDQPFNLTLFTIDTHGLSGRLNKTCMNKGYKDFTGIVECTGVLAADLIDYADKKNWLDKMDIVVIGDHLAMQNLVSNKLSQAKNRYIFNMIISKNQQKKNTNEIVHFDMLPTILTSLGFDIEGGRLGLGYSAIGASSPQRPHNRVTEMQKRIPYESKAYQKLWIK
jgi:phosphoglycerol transferase